MSEWLQPIVICGEIWQRVTHKLPSIHLHLQLQNIRVNGIMPQLLPLYPTKGHRQGTLWTTTNSYLWATENPQFTQEEAGVPGGRGEHANHTHWNWSGIEARNPCSCEPTVLTTALACCPLWEVFFFGDSSALKSPAVQFTSFKKQHELIRHKVQVRRLL